MHTVALVFDNESQDKINNIRNVLNDNNIKSDLILNHISIVGFMNDLSVDIIQEINSYFKDLNPIELTIIGINTFNDEKNVIYLEFGESRELKKIQKEFIDYMKQYNLEIKKYYLNDFIPHTTVAININKKEMYDGVKLLNEKIVFPIKVVLNKIDFL